MMYDFHTHSRYSMDSESSMEDMVKEAINKNLEGICFTDHYDIDSTLDRIDFIFETSDYFEEIIGLKNKYINDIRVFGGVEISIQPHLFNTYNNFIQSNKFDFVLMSIHSVDRMDIHADNYTKKFSPLEVIKNYYSDMHYCIKNFNNYDVLGHLDYIDRYFDDFSYIPPLKEYYDYVESMLKILIQNGKGIEINTAGLRYGLDYFHPKHDILKLYRDLGGEIITLGSDAHTPENIGHKHDFVKEKLKNLGFKYIHFFDKRNLIPVKIE